MWLILLLDPIDEWMVTHVAIASNPLGAQSNNIEAMIGQIGCKG